MTVAAFAPARTAGAATAPVIDVTMPAVVLAYLRSLASVDARARECITGCETKVLTEGGALWGRPTGKACIWAGIECLDFMANELGALTHLFIERRQGAAATYRFSIFDVDHAREAVHWARVELLDELTANDKAGQVAA
ncbi:hypothetical protein ACH427_32235 [Streptomyces sp. NPDC020379]|uniref:hypothetical protein n=1 Tax=Streptomyces sp. NPDC020379 TaxID=3365071 RepID=UPI00379E784B